MMTFLIIEDSAEYAAIVAHYLTGLSDKTIVAKSWDEAWPHLINPQVRLAWIDLIIPPSVHVEEALIYISEARSKRPDLVMVVVSGVTSDRLKERLMAAGADAYLHKLDADSDQQIASLILLAATSAVRRGAEATDLLDKALHFMNKFVAPIESIR